jgi:hypothetical protein
VAELATNEPVWLNCHANEPWLTKTDRPDGPRPRPEDARRGEPFEEDTPGSVALYRTPPFASSALVNRAAELLPVKLGLHGVELRGYCGIAARVAQFPDDTSVLLYCSHYVGDHVAVRDVVRYVDLKLHSPLHPAILQEGQAVVRQLDVLARGGPRSGPALSPARL